LCLALIKFIQRVARHLAGRRLDIRETRKVTMKKHEKFGLLRRHQLAAAERAREVAKAWHSAATKAIVLAHVTPGGGKTLMASIFAHVLIELGVIERVLWLVPRDSLREQVARSFTVKDRSLVYSLRPVTGGDSFPRAKQLDMSGEVGVVTTLHTACAKSKVVARWVAALPTLVIIDESHHLSVDGIADPDAQEESWTTGIAQIVGAANQVICMSGTLARHDGRRIAFCSYDADNKPVSDKGMNYPRVDALVECAVRRIEFFYLDGDASYQHLGERHEVRISEATSKKKAARAVSAAIAYDSDYRDDAVRDAIGHWRTFRQATAYFSRMIIVADSQKSAKHYAKLVRDEFALNVTLAISERPDSAKAIARFRSHRETSDVLITVGMAHEGLDVPDCTHLVCLTRIRSLPWLEQAFARVTRFDASSPLTYDEQRAFIFVPDDLVMNGIVTLMNAVEATAVDERARTGNPVPARGPSSFIPEGALTGTLRRGDETTKLSDVQSGALAKLDVDFPELVKLPIPRRLEIASRMGFLAA